MRKIICEGCGSSFISKVGAYMICQNCGSKYFDDETKGVETLLERAKTFERLGEVEKARSVYRQMTDEYPSDFRGWFGMLVNGIGSRSSISYRDGKICYSCGKWYGNPRGDDYGTSTCSCGSKEFRGGYCDGFNTRDIYDCKLPFVTIVEPDKQIVKNALATASEQQRSELMEYLDKVQKKNEQLMEECKQKEDEIRRKWQQQRAIEKRWATVNGQFLNGFKAEAICIRFNIACSKYGLASKLTRVEKAYNIKYTYAFWNIIGGTYDINQLDVLGKQKTFTREFFYKLDDSCGVIEGDIRPSMDGLQMRGFFKKVFYDYKADR